MKINSEKLYDFINNLGIDEKVRFKVFFDDNYVTEIYWNGESFDWDTGTFTSEAFFNPLYDFVVEEEENKIPEKLEDISEIKCVGCKVEINIAGNKTLFDTDTPIVTEHCIYKINQLIKNQKKIIDYLKSKGDE